MRRLGWLRPSPTMAIACAALLVALGGTSIAATSLVIPRNSVGTVQLKNNAVISSKVRDGSLLARDFRLGQIPRGARGAQGPRGPQGPQGPQGPPGTAANIAGVAAGGDLAGTYPNPAIGDAKVTTAKLADNGITTAKLADNGVTTAKLADGAVAAAKLADNGVTAAKVLDRSLRLADVAVLSGQVAVDVPSVGADSCLTQSVPVTGRQANDVLILRPSTNFTSGLVIMPFVDTAAGDNFLVRVCNLTGAAVDPPSGSWAYAVLR